MHRNYSTGVITMRAVRQALPIPVRRMLVRVRWSVAPPPIG